MSIIEKIHSFIFNRSSVLDSFENSLLDILAKNLDDKRRKVLSLQRSCFNKVYRDYEQEKKKETSYFYWQFFGRSRVDFPELFPVNQKEQKLAALTITVPSGETIDVSYWVVNGVLFYIELCSEDELFRPLSPDFEVSNLQVNTL